ncbi:probable peptidoglycan muropeptide transporter SLC46 [Plodia interpunctella]|uniref:probable peptidoglycan muropeptide transporter SLC46 n=1 Tax=Plodia interpunctella TaxID=58824 RepID=UPI002367CA10|nr:proton-coupled folate transporter-like [Plodia interpunctella]XP_053614455.1 proton-coupled folate transporter-like [Plodia interpunctella]XP_053614456.1 proton-coupled folate transporter-like [Plodia interpunctella]
MGETMTQEEEQILERNSNTDTVVESPGGPNFILELNLFLTMIGITLSSTALSNIMLYRACVHSLHHSAEECHPFLSPERTNSTKHLEVDVQKYVTYVGTVKEIFEYLGPAILCLFLGVWSDTHGRKPLIVWPLFGITLSAMLAVVYSMMDSLGPWWTIVLSAPTTLTGGISVMVIGMYCCLSDMTNKKSMSFRMMSLEIAVALGTVIGSLVCSPLLKSIGNVYVLLIAASVYVLAYSVTNIWLQESLATAIPGTLASVFNFSLIKMMITDCFKRRPDYLRTQLFVLTAASSLSTLIIYGVTGLQYMYARQKLHWALKDFNQFSAINVILAFIGSSLVVVVFQRIFKVNDLTVSTMSFASAAGDFAIRTFAVASWQMYLAACVASFSGLSSPLIRSFLVKILPSEDMAKVFALMGAIGGIMPLLAPPLYNSLYYNTISSFPGAVMLLSSCINASCIIMLLVVVYLRWKSKRVINFEPANSFNNDHEE